MLHITAFILCEMQKPPEDFEQKRDVIRLCFTKLTLVARADNKLQ